jgi:hypothetical protein
LLLVAVLLVSSTLYTLSNKKVYAAQLTSRKVTLGSSAGNTATTWTFSFSAPGSSALNGIAFQVCDKAAGACVTPSGWANTGATFTSLTYNGSTQAGWTLDNAGAGGAQYLGIKNNSSATATANPIVATFSSVTNPNTSNEAFYIRITTFTGDDFTTPLDSGVVAASTAEQIVLTGTMPESLIFCTGESITMVGTIPDCSSATPGTISFNQLFDPTDTAWAVSQMAASTNAGSGYVITVNGPTMTSGSSTIPAIGGSATASNIGVGQFGLNLQANTTPAVTGSEDENPDSNGTNYKGQPSAPFATPDQFAFQANTVQQVAASDDGGAGATDSQRFTVSYIVNVSGSQTAGTYTSTLTYICTPTF